MTERENILAALHNAYSHVDDIIEALETAVAAAKASGDMELAAHIAEHIEGLMYPLAHLVNEFRQIAYAEGIEIPSFMYPKMFAQ
jgi:hypothetical protein